MPIDSPSVLKGVNTVPAQRHPMETWLYCSSRALERGGYYGIRALLLLYMTGPILKMPTAEALEIYGWFTASIVLSQIMGAVVGDLLIGNKKALIAGGLMQGGGAMLLCIPTEGGLYAGMALVMLGGGFYTPNLLARFGKLYKRKLKVLDAAFVIYYLSITIGSFVGVMLIEDLSEINYSAGFIIAGIFMISSVLIVAFVKQEDNLETDDKEGSFNNKWIILIIAFIAVGFFWGVYELAGENLFYLQRQIAENTNLPKTIVHSLNPLFTFILAIIVGVIWSYFYFGQIVKLSIGFLIASASFAILLFVPQSPTDGDITIFVISVLLLALAELHISPIVYAVVTRYCSSKYLAIMMSLIFLPTRLFISAAVFLSGQVEESLHFKYAAVALAIAGILLLLFTMLNRGISVSNDLTKRSI